MDDSSSQRVRVLVVDDEAKLAELLRLELDIEGYDVDVANDGASGLVMARKEPCLLYTSPSPRDKRQSRMPSSA